MKALIMLVAGSWLLLPLPAARSEEVQEKGTAGEAAAGEAAAEAAPEVISEQQYYRDVQTLVRSGKLDEASQKFAEGLAKYPESELLPRLHLLFYSAFARANRPEEAYRHLEQSVHKMMAATGQSPRMVESLAAQIGMLSDAAMAQGGKERAMEVLDGLMERASALPQGAEEVKNAIDARRAIVLAKAGETEAARALYGEQLQAAQAALEASPADDEAVDRMAVVLKDRIQLERAIEGGDEQAAWTALLDFLDEQARAHPQEARIAGRFVSEHLSRAATLARTTPDEAEALSDRITRFQENEGAEASIVAMYASQIERLRKSIETSRRLLALIGSSAIYPENVDGWANGGPLGPADLQGKVVLLDFFAVWCGPCIATFPHLRQWHDEYASQGLQIVGISRYYKYGWDDEAQRSKREEAIEPADERAAMEKFLAHHELRHPVAFVTDAALQEHYGVSGIPHAVVIDRQGIVRLFRIGSGDQNAHDLEEMIKQCLAE